MHLHTSPSRTLTAGIVALGLLVSGCGDDGETTTVDDAWARTSPMNAEAGAIYFTISSEDGAVITGASVPADVAGIAELHETVMAETDDMADDDMDDMEHDDEMDHDDHGDHDMGGAMTMQEVTTIAIPAGESVSFEPGGLHVMLFDLADPLEVGETFDLTLEFETGDPMTVEIDVRDEAP